MSTCHLAQLCKAAAAAAVKQAGVVLHCNELGVRGIRCARLASTRTCHLVQMCEAVVVWLLALCSTCFLLIKLSAWQLEAGHGCAVEQRLA
jgi:hypothetical protein